METDLSKTKALVRFGLPHDIASKSRNVEGFGQEVDRCLVVLLSLVVLGDVHVRGEDCVVLRAPIGNLDNIHPRIVNVTVTVVARRLGCIANSLSQLLTVLLPLLSGGP